MTTINKSDFVTIMSKNSDFDVFVRDYKSHFGGNHAEVSITHNGRQATVVHFSETEWVAVKKKVDAFFSGPTEEMQKFKGVTCRGCYALGTACGKCERCAWERKKMADTRERSGKEEQKPWTPYTYSGSSR